MLQRPNPSDGRGVSPVIGVILMVAITVILAAVIATFVLGLGEQIGNTGPTADFEFDYTEVDNGDDELTIRFGNGQTIDGDNLKVTGVGSGDVDAWNTYTSVGAGDSVTVNPNDGKTVRVVWESGGQSSTMGTWEP